MSCHYSHSLACTSSFIPISCLPPFARQTLKLLRDHSDYVRDFDLFDHCDLSNPCVQCDLTKESNKLRSEVAYWKSMHRKAKARQAELVQENKELRAKLKQRERLLFGRKSEQSNGKTLKADSDKDQTRKRGQQPGTVGHGRRRHDNLQVKEEVYDLSEDAKCCPRCGRPFDLFPGTQDSELVEVEVMAHIRRIKRKQYKRTCSCQNLPAIITANGPDKLVPKGAYGDSVWVQVLLDKFLLYRPTYRFLESLKLVGLNIAQGTITDGLKRLSPLFQPIYHQIIAKNQTENHWHADETRWLICEEIQGKTGYRWYLWVFKSASTVVYIMDKSRSSKVPKNHLKDAEEVILSVDRYSAYKALAKDKNGSIRLAFCWAHVRRDFLNLAKDWPKLEDWAMGWVKEIGTLYYLNGRRSEVGDDSPQLPQAEKRLRQAVDDMSKQCEKELKNKELHPACKKVLNSLKRHWPGLTIFVDHPEIPMDNNAAERALRGPVVGRKNFYGSGSLWSGELAATLFTIFQTLKLWDINPKSWLQAFLRACAENGGQPLEDVSSFLPWTMTTLDRQTYSRPLQPHDTS